MKVKFSIYEADVTEEDVAKMFQDIQFYEEALASLLDPKRVEESWDFFWKPGEYLYWLREKWIKEKTYSKEFIDKLFEGKEIITPAECYLEKGNTDEKSR
jgi:hypothetical protein